MSYSSLRVWFLILAILIRLKYNFIHYNPFPKVESSTIKEFILETKTSAKKMYSKGWRLAHAIKTSQSAQLDSFNFLCED